MEDVYIDLVKLKNCRGHYEMEMDFPMDNFTVIQGKNGAGKSTIPKSISMGLFGDDGAPPGDKILITDMLNRKKKKDLEIEIHFRVIEDGVVDNYRVELNYEHKSKPNKLFLYKNDVDISAKTKGDTYKKIEGLIYPKDVYHNVIYFSQQVKNFFTSLTNSEQKQIFDSILQTKVYDTYYKNSFEAEKKIQDLLIALNGDISCVSTELTMHKDRLSMLESTLESEKQQSQKIISELKSKKIDAENKLQVADDTVANFNFDESAYKALQIKVIKLQQAVDGLDANKSEQLSNLDSKRISEFREIELEIGKRKQIDKDKLVEAYTAEKQGLTDQSSKLYEKIAEVSKKYDTTSISKDCSEFESEKRKEQQSIQFEINQLDTEFSTSQIEFERDERLVIIDRNIQECRDKAAEVKSKAATMLTSRKELESTVEEDEKSLNGDKSICSKCLRPFTSSDDTSAIKDDIKKNKERIKELTSQLTKYQEDLNKLGVEFEDGNNVKSKAKSDYDEKIKAVVQSKAKKAEEYQRKHSLINQEIEEYKSTSDKKINDIREKMDSETKDLRDELETIKSKIYKLELDHTHKIDEISTIYSKETQNKETEHNKKYSDLRADLSQKLDAECSEKKKECYDNERELLKIEQQKTFVDKAKDQKKELQYELNSIIDRIKEAESNEFDDTQIKTTKSNIDDVSLRLEEFVTNRTRLERELEIVQFWKHGFSDAGIKSMLIDMAIPHMNESVAEALEKMAPGVFTVSFDTLRENKSGDISDKFTVNVIHNIKGTDSHKMLSGGEKRIVDLACMEALRSLTEKLYNKRIHNIFYDEVLDSLDEDNRQIFCQVSKLISSDKNVTLITHNTADDMEPDRIFKF